MSISAYKRTMRDTQSPREIERQIISRITATLAVHAQSYDTAENARARLAILSGGLQAALIENIRLWSALKADLGRESNELPVELRAQLISLALFVERHTSHVLRGEGEVEALIAVNRSIIEGLAGLSPQAAA